MDETPTRPIGSLVDILNIFYISYWCWLRKTTSNSPPRSAITLRNSANCASDEKRSSNSTKKTQSVCIPTVSQMSNTSPKFSVPCSAQDSASGGRRRSANSTYIGKIMSIAGRILSPGRNKNETSTMAETWIWFCPAPSRCDRIQPPVRVFPRNIHLTYRNPSS